MPEYDADAQSSDENARIIKSVVTPRPIAWISTVSAEGVTNLAPFSSYNYISSRYPIIMFNSPNEDHGGLKDTARNVLDTEEFAVNIVTEEQISKMDHSSESLPPDVSEFDSVGVEPVPCTRISPPRVAESPVTMECTLYDSMKIHDRIMILGAIEYFHVDESVCTNDKVDSQKLSTVGRLGGPYYTVSDPAEFVRQF